MILYGYSIADHYVLGMTFSLFVYNERILYIKGSI